MDEKFCNITTRVPVELRDRADALTEALKEDAELSALWGGEASRSAIFRLAFLRGIELLEVDAFDTVFYLKIGSSGASRVRKLVPQYMVLQHAVAKIGEAIKKLGYPLPDPNSMVVIGDDDEDE